MAFNNPRSAMVLQAEWALKNEPKFHYAQDRPIPLARFKAHTLPITTDCSGFVTCIAYAAGVTPDPNHQSYNGQGFTGTLLDHLPHIDKRNAKAGDFIVYGPYPGEHVVMLLEDVTATNDPFVVSHGNESGPIRIRSSAEASAHHSPSTYLRSVVEVAEPKYYWTIRKGDGTLIASTRHPALWAASHTRSFRRHGSLNFHRHVR